ncbi:MAG: hypothetical protein E7441_05965 [Ruminococcaceae bacterium]|nr:hypothetical protein [Oscillospiraceae bacterium]
MRNKMKKALSLILAMCIAATLVPAAFADTTETVDGTLVYSFMRSDYASASDYDEKSATCVNYSNGNGNLAYYGTDTTSTTTNDWNQPWDGENYSARFQFGSGWGKVSGDTTYYHYAAFKIKGIELYEYNVTFDYVLHSAGADKANVYILNPEQTAEILAGTKTVAEVINGNNIVPVFSNINMLSTENSGETKTATAAFIPEGSGEHLLVFTRANSGSTKNVFPHKLTFTPIKGKASSFSFAADADSVETESNKEDEYYFSTTKPSSSLTDDNSGYVKFADDMYITESSAIRQLRLPNVDVYSSTDATASLGKYGRYTLVSNNIADFYNYGCMFLKHKLGSDGIYNITVTTGKYKRGGRIAVYANDVYIGNINDYQVNFTGTSTEMGDGEAELHTTDLKAVNLTRDSDGYVELAFRAIEGEGTNTNSGGTAKNVDFIPYSVDFELVEASEVAEPEIVSNTTVAAYVMNDVDGTIAETPVNSGVAGRAVTYTATPADGYKFVCWTDKDGKVLSEDVEYTFNAYTNMTIYANFDETDAVGVKFYNGNGEFLGFVEKESGKTFVDYKSEAPVAEYDGATFEGWSVSDETVVNGIVYAIAQFTDISEDTVTATIKINGNPSINGSVAIGTPVVCTNDSTTVTAWYRDGKFVSYNPVYTHYAFKDALLNSGKNTIENKAPVAILDDIGDGSYMFEYDGGDYTVLAAGIVFGNSEDVSVSSCYANAKARNISGNHGQFKACVNSSGDATKQSVARGYVIYSDSGKIKVLYGDLD